MLERKHKVIISILVASIVLLVANYSYSKIVVPYVINDFNDIVSTSVINEGLYKQAVEREKALVAHVLEQDDIAYLPQMDKVDIIMLSNINATHLVTHDYFSSYKEGLLREVLIFKNTECTMYVTVTTSVDKVLEIRRVIYGNDL